MSTGAPNIQDLKQQAEILARRYGNDSVTVIIEVILRDGTRVKTDNNH